MTKPPFKLADYTDEQIKSLKAALDEYMPKREAIQKLVTNFKDEVIKMGANWDDAVSVLLGKKSVGRKPAAKKVVAKTVRAAPGTAPKKVPVSQDKNGASPEPGTTYVLKDGTAWTKDPNGFGATKKAFIAAVQAGETWAAMSNRNVRAAKKVAPKKAAAKKVSARKTPATKKKPAAEKA